MRSMRTLLPVLSIALAGCSSGTRLEPIGAPGTCRDFCVSVDESTIGVGEPIVGVVSWRGAPPGSVLSLSLERADGDRQEIQNRLTIRSKKGGRRNDRFDGSLLERRLAIPRDGSVRFRWSGDGFSCHRTEIIETCPGRAVPGRHVISAMVLDEKSIVHPFNARGRDQEKPAIFFMDSSSVFTIR